MKIYFCDRFDKLRLLAEVPKPVDANELFKVVGTEAKKFCDPRGFTIHYMRAWVERRDGVEMTKFDVGSHSEFFYADEVIREVGGV